MFPAWTITVWSMNPKPTIGMAQPKKCFRSCSGFGGSIERAADVAEHRRRHRDATARRILARSGKHVARHTTARLRVAWETSFKSAVVATKANEANDAGYLTSAGAPPGRSHEPSPGATT
mmetsp:Transcript_22570/g.72630  ORF Transcript_22570/g.72630 Transcript_22570/m.72630 type:complete len:120 (-) Transcript_22570:1195-1554(-)